MDSQESEHNFQKWFLMKRRQIIHKKKNTNNDLDYLEP